MKTPTGALGRSDAAGPRHSWAGRLAMSALLVPLLMAVFAVLPQTVQPTGAAAPQALILGDSVSGSPSLEQTEAEADGFTVTVIDGTTWDSEPASYFAGFQVIIIGDPTCGTSPDFFQAAVTNASTWEPVVLGSGGARVVIGTDPVYHYDGGSAPAGNRLIGQGIAFAGGTAGETGAYVDLSCAYNSDPATAVPLLDGLSTHGPGQFQATGVDAPGTSLCAGNIAIVAQSGPTAGLTDDDLSGWSCSVHEFFTKYPSDFSPLALATDPAVPAVYCADDIGLGGSTSPLACGSPYILVSGAVTIKSDITLTPATGTAPAGTSYVFTANVVDSSGAVLPGATVTFLVESGPDAGQTGTGVTNSAGNATFTVKNGGTLGNDSVSASFVNAAGATEKALAAVTWTTATSTTTPPTTAGAATPVAAAPAFTG